MKFLKRTKDGLNYYVPVKGGSGWDSGLQDFRLPVIRHYPDHCRGVPSDSPFRVGDWATGFWCSTLAEAKAAVREQARYLGVI